MTCTGCDMCDDCGYCLRSAAHIDTCTDDHAVTIPDGVGPHLVVPATGEWLVIDGVTRRVELTWYERAEVVRAFGITTVDKEGT